MKNQFLKLREKLVELERQLTQMITFYQNNEIHFFANFEKFEKIKTIRFGLRMAIETTSEYINEKPQQTKENKPC